METAGKHDHAWWSGIVVEVVGHTFAAKNMPQKERKIPQNFWDPCTS